MFFRKLIKVPRSNKIPDLIGPFDLQGYIRNSFDLRPVKPVTEILLRTAGPRSGLWRIAEQVESFSPPYWAYAWAGGLALARHVLNHPDTVKGKRVIDLGAGSGLVAISASVAGAAHVVASDIDACAAAAISVNARENAVALDIELKDLTEARPPEVDIVLVGDLFYDRKVASKIAAFLKRCAAADISILVGDPGRVFLPKEHLKPLAFHAAPDFSFTEEMVQEKKCNVFQFL